jgi:beta-lactam-binding protein with PASTA domain
LQKDNGVIELVYAKLITTYPDFTDGTYDKALIEQFCEDNKITCKFREEEDNNFNEGAIMLQSRSAGDEVKEGVTLTITIATNSKEETNKEVEGN